MSNYINCKFCKSFNIKDSNYCKNCGHKFGSEDLDREFRAGNLEALSNINSQLFKWISSIGIIIAILGFFSISSIKDLYKSELKEIVYEKNKLENSYKELQSVTNSLNSLMGNKDDNYISLPKIMRILYANFYSIKDIYIEAEYLYKNPINEYGFYYSMIDLKKGNRNLIEFQTTNQNILRVDDDKLLIKYTPFQFFESKIKSKELSSLNGIQEIKLRGAERVNNENHKNLIINRKNELKNIKLDIYVNSMLFWTLNFSNPREEEIITKKIDKGNYTDLFLSTKYFNVESDLDNIDIVLNRIFNKIIDKE